MKANNKWTARILSLLIVALLFLLLNYVITGLIGKSLSKDMLRDEQIANVVKLIKDSNIDYNKVNIIINSEKSQPLFSFYIFALILIALVVSVYSFVLATIKRLLHLE